MCSNRTPCGVVLALGGILASHDNLASQRPTRRQVAKGAAWAAPVLTTAALAPRVAATTLECTPASQQTINNAMTMATTKTHPLQLNFYQPTGVFNDGGAQTIYVNLRNDGSGSRVLAASSTNPVVVKITVMAVPGSGNGTRRLDILGAPNFDTTWGSLERTGDRVSSSSPVVFTWTITDPIIIRTGPTSECDMHFTVATQLFSGSGSPLIYATAQMTSFGTNDDLAAADLPELSTLDLGAQEAPCQDYYAAQVSANTGANAASYTLRAQGALQPNGTDWPVGSIADTRTLGNGSGIGLDFGTGQNYNGIW